ncbi:mitogen-activated protein kinase kinase kinase 5 isoform X1 [Paramormyrops kingsleyae]|uniref:mitogen-activated protein kinase kinase kinase 5 isoform X1 n=2 Tax=Paramormyrops kingsleyae TaxID=1676925 RepID=UPI003B97B051
MATADRGKRELELPAGSMWQNSKVDLSNKDVIISSTNSRTRNVTVVYVVPRASLPETGVDVALACLQKACEEAHASLKSVPLDKVVLSIPDVLDTFYNSDVAVVEMSDSSCQQSLFYHLGVRESFQMTNNVILYCSEQGGDLLTLREGCGTYTFIQYLVSPQGKAFTCEAGTAAGIKELLIPRIKLEPLLTPLVEKFIQLLENVQIHHSEYSQEKIRQEIRTARERFSGPDLSHELGQIQKRLDTMEQLSPDIIMNLLLCYRDIQDYGGVISLVETLTQLPTCAVATQQNIKFHYIFALNRRNAPGDRDKALSIIIPIVESGDRVPSDVYCLCGRIYKDVFLSSNLSDPRARDQACYWYGKAFETEPTLHSGINCVVLLMAAGHKYETSVEMRKIGVTLSSLLGRKGSLEKMQDYWDVGFYLGANLLVNEHKKVLEASEKLYKLNAPMWYVASVMETYIIYRNFVKCHTTKPPPHELVNFWMELLLQACKPTVCPPCCQQVLILEPTKVFQPSMVSVSEDDDSRTVQLRHVTTEKKGLHQWTFPASAIRGVSVSKFDGRCCFLYVLYNSDDFQLYFPSELHCKRFCELVNSLIQQTELPLEESGLDSCGAVLDFEYEKNESGDRVILGKGTYGVVYAGKDTSNQVRIAIKEIPEKHSMYSQPLHEEIGLHKRLKHRNIVQYLGSISQGGYIKIFMEEVPGGSLSSLLRSKWGPLKGNEATIVFYTKQILDGLKYLHDNQIVHRDIKGDNVLINTYSGVLKISDFGTSKRLAGINPCTETFTGTLQYMAPEIIDLGPRGYGKPADIWSLGCTIIEMATGKTPFHELGNPQAAMFKVGMFKTHPTVPESMSEAAKTFIMCCFEPDPDKRATASRLLQDIFLKLNGRKKKVKPVGIMPPIENPARVARAYSPGELHRSHSMPTSEQAEDCSLAPKLDLGNSLDLRRVMPTCPKKQGLDSFLSIPDDTSDISPFTTGENLGLFLLRKVSERRTTLNSILCENINTVVSNIQEMLPQHPEGHAPSKQHITDLICCLREHVHQPDRTKLNSCLKKLRSSLLAAAVSQNSVQAMLFGFQDAVRKVLKQQQVKPHWMFALDNLLRQAVQDAIVILLPELQLQLDDTEEAGDGELESSPSKKKREAAPVTPWEASNSEQPTPSLPDISSYHITLTETLRQIRQDTKRLLTELREKEEEYQKLLMDMLQEKQEIILDFKTRGNCTPTETVCPSHHVEVPDPEALSLIRWLRNVPVDENTIEILLVHQFTLELLLQAASRDDLKYCKIRGGMVCRLWNAIVAHRNLTNSHGHEREEAFR